MERTHIYVILSYRRIRRYIVRRLKRLEACDFSHMRFTDSEADEIRKKNNYFKHRFFDNINFIGKAMFFIEKYLDTAIISIK